MTDAGSLQQRPFSSDIQKYSNPATVPHVYTIHFLPSLRNMSLFSKKKASYPSFLFKFNSPCVWKVQEGWECKKQNKTKPQQPRCLFFSHNEVRVKEELLSAGVFCTWNATLSGDFFPLFESELKCVLFRRCSLWHVTKECDVITAPIFYTLQS